jgi:peptidoglycan-associated lipoprotein
MTSFKKALALTVTVLALSACSKDVSDTSANAATANDAAQKAAGANGEATGAAVGGQIEETAAAANAAKLESNKAHLSTTTFYFDFDRYAIKEESKKALMAHGAYLALNPGAKVVLEGHTDERGTVEYNLALGEDRAKSVKRYLLVQGAAASQVETVSLGEERPVQLGQSEAAWSQNRRVALQYTSK